MGQGGQKLAERPRLAIPSGIRGGALRGWALGLVLLFSGFEPLWGRPIGGVGSVGAFYSFNQYALDEVNRALFFLNASDLFDKGVNPLEPVRFGNGFGGSFRYGVGRRLFVELGGERLEARSVGGGLSLQQTVLVDLDLSLWSGRVGVLYAFPVRWGVHINAGVMAVPVFLRGERRIRISGQADQINEFKGNGVGLEAVVAEPEFFFGDHQSLKVTFGFRNLVIKEVTDVTDGTVIEDVLGPNFFTGDPLPFDYGGLFVRMGVHVNLGKGR